MSKKRVIVFTGIIILIAIGFLMLYVEAYRESSALFKSELVNGEKNNSFDLEISVSEGWDSPERLKNEKFGAQYDGIITNNTEMNLSDWIITLEVPMECRIDSAWNGEYVIEGNCIIITPMEYNNPIKAGESITFGSVLYSGEVMDFTGGSIEGRLVRKVTQYKRFWALAGCLVLWVIILLIHLVSEIKVARYRRRQKRDEEIISQAMDTMAGLIDAKDPYTREHSRRVAEYSVELGKRLGLSGEELQNLYYIALMHDCGKIGTTDVILNKNAKLSDEERIAIETHTIAGGKALKNFTAIEGISDGAMYHHERYDGKGYPEGLAGEEIPFYARIICIADSFDTMNSDRCYRAKLPMEQILKELNDNMGKQFDPNIAIHMIAMIKEGYFGDF